MSKTLEPIIAHLEESIKDEIFSKAEKRSLKSLIGDMPLDQHQLNFLRSKMYELANQKITTENYGFILEWIKNVNNTLVFQPQESSGAYFSPGDACRSAILSQINNAISTVKICVFTISDDIITNSIITSHKKGVNVQIITDNDKSLDDGSDVDLLAEAGISVRMDATPNHMHHKFMVVDDRSLLTGSYNWTRSAAMYNHENILHTEEGGVVRTFLKEFSQLWRVMEPYR